MDFRTFRPIVLSMALAFLVSIAGCTSMTVNFEFLASLPHGRLSRFFVCKPTLPFLRGDICNFIQHEFDRSGRA